LPFPVFKIVEVKFTLLMYVKYGTKLKSVPSVVGVNRNVSSVCAPVVLWQNASPLHATLPV